MLPLDPIGEQLSQEVLDLLGKLRHPRACEAPRQVSRAQSWMTGVTCLVAQRLQHGIPVEVQLIKQEGVGVDHLDIE